MKTDYIGHDRVYKRLKAKGAFGWTSEADQIQVVQPRVLETIHQLALAPGSRILDMGCGHWRSGDWAHPTGL
jgi:cyclopropane fatty-acyl-phospholipid synthase-like methyltransferase